MKSLNLYQRILQGALFILILSGCGKVLTDTNLSPNTLSAEQVDPAFTMTQVISSSAMNMALTSFAGNTTQCVVPYAMQYSQQDFSGVAITNTFGWKARGWSYRELYLPLSNAAYLQKRAIGSADSAFFRGVALVMKSYWFGYYTSGWGNMPYSQAMQGTDGILKPVYDKQKDVFKGILSDLEAANQSLKNATSVTAFTKNADIMYKGDPLKWRAFANSLHLRFLMRLSEKTNDMKDIGVDVKAEFSKIASNPSNYPLITSSSNNASIVFPGTSALDSWPLGAFNQQDPSVYYRLKPAAPFINFLKNSHDPRLTVWFKPVDVPTIISDKGADEVIMKDTDGKVKRFLKTYQPGVDTSLYVGLLVALPNPDTYNKRTPASVNLVKSLDPAIYTAGAANPFVSYMASMFRDNTNPLVPQVFISASEVNFTLAEAVVRGWIAGSAIDYYKNGISTSLDQYKIANGDNKVYNPQNHQIESFDLNSFLNSAVDSFNNASDKIQPIIEQKWVADFTTVEAWFNWRRTGYPNLGQNIISGPQGDKIPVRFPYGDNEKNFNGGNVDIAIQDLQPAVDDIWSKMWLLQGTGKPW